MSKYHIRDKFVIEIDEVFENDADDFIHEEKLYRIKGFNSLVFDDNGLDKLQKYETFTVRPDAWDESLKEQYNKGLEDAWKFVRKIFDLNNSSMEKVFGFREKRKVFDTLDVQEALAKLEAYEKAQEINVGDVVTTINGECGYIVTNVQLPNTLHCINSRNGYTLQMKISGVKKTGKHIDISSILEQIGGGE